MESPAHPGGCCLWIRGPVRSAFLFAVILTVIILTYWWLLVQWSSVYFIDPGIRFTFITITFLLVLIIADSAFLIRYYQLLRRFEFERQADELRESEEKYRTIIEEMQDMFYRTDLEGRITMISPAGVKLAGYASLDEMIGLQAQDMYMDPDERERLLFAVAETGEITGYPLQLRRRDGSIRFVTTSSHVIHDAQGKVAGLEGIIHDITPARRAEDALKEANRKLNLLSSVTRHDIINQLLILKGFLALLKKKTDNLDLLNYINSSDKAAMNIEHQIIFTRDYQDMGVKEPGWQNVNRTIIGAKGALAMGTVSVEMDRPDLEVFADPLFEKVFYNMIDNSLKYGGEQLSTIRISSHEENNTLVIRYTDDGAGITGEDHAHLFERGYGKHTGFGLFLSREILSITGISISETGTPGIGVLFTIRVPKGMYRFQNGVTG